MGGQREGIQISHVRVSRRNMGIRRRSNVRYLVASVIHKFNPCHEQKSYANRAPGLSEQSTNEGESCDETGLDGETQFTIILGPGGSR